MGNKDLGKNAGDSPTKEELQEMGLENAPGNNSEDYKKMNNNKKTKNIGDAEELQSSRNSPYGEETVINRGQEGSIHGDPQESNRSPSDLGHKQEEVDTLAEKRSQEERGNDLPNLQAELADAKKEIENLKYAWSQERADFQNYKKRITQEREKNHQQIIAALAQQFLPVLDDIDKIVQFETENEEIKLYIEGVVLIRKRFLAILNEMNIYETKPYHEKFDPLTMEAIASEICENHEQDDRILDVLQAGYVYQKKGDKTGLVVRAARVKVGKASKKE